jgi:hypothetical protein
MQLPKSTKFTGKLPDSFRKKSAYESNPPFRKVLLRRKAYQAGLNVLQGH